jgi:hypothetical protein
MSKTKAENRTEFKLWMDWRPTIDMMTMEERGIFLTMLYDSYQYKAIQPIPEKSTVLKVAWLTMKGLVKRAIKDYDLKRGWVESINYMDTVQGESIDSPKTVQGQSLDSSLPTITTTTTDTLTETITTTDTITNEDEEFIEGLTLNDYMEVEEEVFKQLNKEEKVNLAEVWEAKVNE